MHDQANLLALTLAAIVTKTTPARVGDLSHVDAPEDDTLKIPRDK